MSEGRRVTQAATGLRCDGRTLCSPLTSSQEGTLVVKNCSGEKMDGKHPAFPEGNSSAIKKNERPCGIVSIPLGHCVSIVSRY